MKYPLIRQMAIAIGGILAFGLFIVATWRHEILLALVSFALASVLSSHLDV